MIEEEKKPRWRVRWFSDLTDFTLSDDWLLHSWRLKGIGEIYAVFEERRYKGWFEGKGSLAFPAEKRLG